MVTEPIGVGNEVDGRTARRDRNRIAVLDAVLELFSEGDLVPSPDDVARRSGVSLRSVYRYVADADDLIRSAIERNLEKVEPLFLIDDLGTGSFPHRLEVFLGARMRVYEAIAATARASRLAASRSEVIRSQLERGRRVMRAQLERQFAPELDRLDGEPRDAVLAAADALTQIETIDLYRHNRGLSSQQTREMLHVALRALLIRKY
jgi:TetR/AcrR family transcriptional regulator of autoinduction and epiphytic fitness